MKFGVFYEQQFPRPWSPGAERNLFHEALEQVELADQLGFDYAWQVEHHFLEEYSHGSAPELFLAAASQRTNQIRLGHGIVLMPPGYNHPARVAERIATLDILSDGRVEFGTGESASRMELDGFGVDPAVKHDQWLEAAEQVANMLAMDPYPGFQGRYFSMPTRNIVPKPLQRPHPPMWVACSNHETIKVAARLGLGALTFTFLELEEAKHWVHDYYETLKNECVPLGHTINPNIAFVMGFSVQHDEQEALDRGFDGLRFFKFALEHFYRDGLHVPGRTDIWQMYMDNRERLISGDLKLFEGNMPLTSARGAIGTPAQVRDYVRRLSDLGVDQAIFIQQGGKNRHEDICSALRIFATEVMPEFHNEEEQRQREKMERLAPYIEAAMKRKQYMQALPDENIKPVPALGRVIAEEDVLVRN